MAYYKKHTNVIITFYIEIAFGTKITKMVSQNCLTCYPKLLDKMYPFSYKVTQMFRIFLNNNVATVSVKILYELLVERFWITIRTGYTRVSV